MTNHFLTERLREFGTTIFTQMSALAVETSSVNLGQGFPDTDGPAEVSEAAIEDAREREADVKRWSDEGWKQAEGSYKNGVQDGRWKTWWDNGLISTAVEMKNGRAQGEAKYWYDNGQMKEKGTWAGGKFTATAKWNKAGDPIPVE